MNYFVKNTNPYEQKNPAHSPQFEVIVNQKPRAFSRQMPIYRNHKLLKRANQLQHIKVIKHCLTEKTYQIINKVPFEGNYVRSQNGQPTLENLKVQKLQMKDLRKRIETKLQQRNQEFAISSAQLQITNLKSSQLFKQYLIKHGFRQPAFLKDVM